MSISRENILTLRPIIESIQGQEYHNEEEAFQNKVLRPILKFQNELLLLLFDHFVVKRKSNFIDLSKENKKTYIVGQIRKDLTFKNQLLGAVFSLFSNEEFKYYCNNEKAINKRILSLLEQRFCDQKI